MASAIQFTVTDDDYVELVGAGESGSILHQGGEDDSNTIILVEADIKPSFTPSDAERFKSSPASFYLKSGESEPYFNATTLWAVSASGTQYLSVTPSVDAS